MKKLFGLVAVFFGFLIAVFAVLAMFPPTGLALRLVASGLRNHAGLDLKVAGAHSLRLFPEAVLKVEDITLTTVDGTRLKPLATAKSLQVNASLLTAIRGHYVDRIVLTDPDIDLEIGQDGQLVGVSLTPRRVSASPRGEPISVGVIEVTGARIAYRDQRDGTDVRLERTRATLKDVRLDRFGEALVNAGAVTVKAPGEAGTFEIANLDATASDFEMSRVREFSGNGDAIKWRDARGVATLDAQKFTATARLVSAKGADAVVVTAGEAAWAEGAVRQGSGRSLRTTGMTANIANLRPEGAGGTDFKAGLLTWREATGETYEAANIAMKAGTVRLEGVGNLDFKAGAAAWREADGRDANGRDGGGRAIEAVDVAGTAKSLKPGRVDDLDVASARAMWKDAKRSNSPLSNRSLSNSPLSNSSGGLSVEQASFKTALLAAGAPIEGVAGFRWNGERIDAKVKLPAPDTLATATLLPATIALATRRGTVDFEGAIDTTAGAAKGKTLMASTSVEALAGWLGVSLPATVKGPVKVSGNIDAGPTRIALAGGRIEHGANAVNGDIAIDLTNARPRFVGRLAADKLEADTYLGFEPMKPTPKPTQSTQSNTGQSNSGQSNSGQGNIGQGNIGQGGPRPRPLSVPRPVEVEPEVQLSDVFKSYVRAYVDAPTTRSGPSELASQTNEALTAEARRRAPSKPGFAWSTASIDFSALRAVDLDIDWAVKQLNVRGMELTVPQLKTSIDGGAMTLLGRDVGMQEGRISGEARIDVRQAVPAITANVKGQGVDVLAITEALGLPPMIDGITSIDADVRSTGLNQKQLVEGLTGRVKTDMPQGHVLGYDFGNINLFSLIRMFSQRQFDPERRTPISGLKADLDIDKGNVRDSQLTMGGPFLGVNAEGTIALVEQRLDFSGRARIASIFSGLRFKLFGDWTQPSFQPDILGFSRGGPGEPSLADIVAASDIKPDGEMALLVGRALLKATASGGDANMTALLQALQRKAQGN